MVGMRDVKPPQVKKRDRILPTCSHGECRECVVWDYTACWEHLTNGERSLLRERLSSALRSDENLRGITLTGASLRGFDFAGANLENVLFDRCDLRHANFSDANLRRAFFGWADLREADFVRAELNSAVFTGANLEGVHLTAYSISFGRKPINLTMQSFGREGLFRRPHVCEDGPQFAQATYQALKSHFVSNGDYDSASWASFSERLMQRRVLWNERRLIRWMGSFIFGAISGYGERPARAILASVALVCAYAAAFYASRVVVLSGATLTKVDALTLSVATFAGYSLPDILIRFGSVGRVLLTSEAFLGLFLFGVFIFTLTKRYVAR